MANKKRRKRSRPRPAPARPAPGGTDSPGSGGRQDAPPSPRADRQARKRQARQAREAQMRSVRRRDTIRRAMISGVVGLAVVAGFLYLTRVGGPNPIPAAAVDAAEAAGCSDVETPVEDAPGGQHLQSGESYTYPSEPATSGAHDPSPLPADPAVYPAMQPETRLVHNLEHGFVIVYYRADGEGGLPQEVVTALTTYVNGADHVILTPHTSLPEGTALAMTYWNRVQTCPSTIAASQATTVAQGFATAFECSNIAPEASQC